MMKQLCINNVPHDLLTTRWSNKTSATEETDRNRDYTISSQYKDYLYSNKFRYFSDDSTNSASNNPEMSIDINGKGFVTS